MSRQKMTAFPEIYMAHKYLVCDLRRVDAICQLTY